MTGQETQELASLYALGALDPAERDAATVRIRAGDLELDAEILSFQSITGILGAAVTPVAPPSSLRARLFDRIAAKPADSLAKPSLPQGLAALSRANDMPWKPTPFPGIRSKRLFTNTSDGTTVWLLSMDPGSVYPPHHHTSIEHTYVVSGDIAFEGYSLFAGEYQAALPLSDHDKPITTKNGCTVLIINNAKDEIFAMPPARA